MTDAPRAAAIAAGFATAFIEVNAGVLPSKAALVVRIAAVVLLVVIIGRRIRAGRRAGVGRSDGRAMFGPTYWVVVIIEAAALAVGVIVIRTSNAATRSGGFAAGLHHHADNATRAWIAVVVGVHFLVLAPMWRRGATAVLGVLITASGAVALVLADHGKDAVAVAVAAGFVPGVLLFASSISRLRSF